MIKIRSFFAYFFLTALFSMAAQARDAALYLKEVRPIYQANFLSNGKYKIYSYEAFADGSYSKIVNKNEISLAAKEPVNGIEIGWALAPKNRGLFDHCQVESVFENGYVMSFCDFLQNGVLHRKSLFLRSTDMIGRVEAIEGFTKGSEALIKVTTGGLEAGEHVKVEAIFSNHKALVYQPSLLRFLRGGPYYNSLQFVIDLDNLEPGI